MRIVGGKLRHRIINMTNLETTRETQDKVRQAIFNMIGPYFDGGVCLDLFAGSGAMGIEAYSRGVDKIILNDLNNKALDVCKTNCKSLGINDVEFYNLDYKVFLENYNSTFDLIILDPPYKMDNIDEIIELCNPKLNNNGLLVFEMEKNSKYKEEYENLYLIKDKTYGIKKVIIYEKVVE
jgi:16S rRNA (guanine(966)-N(2))-methyltransferase RsmD